jgi:hypothetical protein
VKASRSVLGSPEQLARHAQSDPGVDRYFNDPMKGRFSHQWYLSPAQFTTNLMMSYAVGS